MLLSLPASKCAKHYHRWQGIKAPACRLNSCQGEPFMTKSSRERLSTAAVSKIYFDEFIIARDRWCWFEYFWFYDSRLKWWDIAYYGLTIQNYREFIHLLPKKCFTAHASLSQCKSMLRHFPKQKRYWVRHQQPAMNNAMARWMNRDVFCDIYSFASEDRDIMTRWGDKIWFTTRYHSASESHCALLFGRERWEYVITYQAYAIWHYAIAVIDRRLWYFCQPLPATATTIATFYHAVTASRVARLPLSPPARSWLIKCAKRTATEARCNVISCHAAIIVSGMRMMSHVDWFCDFSKPHLCARLELFIMRFRIFSQEASAGLFLIIFPPRRAASSAYHASPRFTPGA